MQSITDKNGKRRRAFCLSCLREHKDWVGGDLCEHFQKVEPVGPESKLDPALLASEDPH